jgi:hypothetical protein
MVGRPSGPLDCLLNLRMGGTSQYSRAPCQGLCGEAYCSVRRATRRDSRQHEVLLEVIPTISRQHAYCVGHILPGHSGSRALDGC